MVKQENYIKLLWKTQQKTATTTPWRKMDGYDIFVLIILILLYNIIINLWNVQMMKSSLL